MLMQRRRFWAQIDLDAAKHNYLSVKALLRPHVKLCCVVKANAYGHGAVPLAKLYERMGADYLAVSNIEEALQLRQHRIGLPILILGYTPAEYAGLLAEHKITQAVFSYDYAEELNACAVAANVTLTVHIKLDSGMGRLGFTCRHGAEDRESMDRVIRVCRMENLCAEGIFSHFALADEGEAGAEYTRKQFLAFTEALAYLERRGITFPIRHAANSAAILDFPDYQLDMVRAGIALYGIAPSEQIRRHADLRPVMSLKAVLSSVKELRAGDSVSYGCTFTAPKDMKVATVPAGYADGYRRGGAEQSKMLLRGRRVSIVGRICMDQLMLDVSDIPDVMRDEVVTVIGRDGEEQISAEELARINQTIPYEILCGVGERVPRFYREEGRIVAVKDILLSFEMKEGGGVE